MSIGPQILRTITSVMYYRQYGFPEADKIACIFEFKDTQNVNASIKCPMNVGIGSKMFIALKSYKI